MPAKKSTRTSKSSKQKLRSASWLSFRRTVPFIVAFGIIGSIMLYRSFAAPAQPLSFFNPSITQIDTPVEQQTPWVNVGDPAADPYRTLFPADHSKWVVNPFEAQPCAWDTDDHWKLWPQGYLNPGASSTQDFCMVAESDPVQATHYGTTGFWTNAPRKLGVLLYSTAPGLKAEVCYEPQGRCFALTPRLEVVNRKSTYTSKGCIELAYKESDPALTTIPNSNGGIGLKTTATLRLTNTSAKQRLTISGAIEVIPWGVSASPQYCDLTTKPLQAEYPFKFSL